MTSSKPQGMALKEKGYIHVNHGRLGLQTHFGLLKNSKTHFAKVLDCRTEQTDDDV